MALKKSAKKISDKKVSRKNVKFLKREKVLKSDGSGKFLTAYDFKVGEIINIYGRNIYIYNCD